MPNEDDARLIDVASEVKRLRKELSDAEWDDTPDVPILRSNLAHYEALAEQGVLWEPTF
jgi:hypothetical protein